MEEITETQVSANEVVVLVPALHRPGNVEPLATSLKDAEEQASLTLVYVLSREDREMRAACRASGVGYVILVHPRRSGDYARKINFGVSVTNEEWILLAADDLRFHPGWADEAIRVGLKSGAKVIGTNDLGNPLVRQGLHSTHTLVHRSYVEQGTIDERSKLLHEGYHHNWVDNEFIETAKHRGQFVFASRSRVEHLHPHWHKGEMDETYQLGQQNFLEDRRLFMERRRLWKTPLSGVSQRRARRHRSRHG